MRSRQALSSLLIALLLACACDRQNQPENNTNAAQDGRHKHDHVAPHGGTVVVLGDEIFHLELVHDSQDGRLTLYVLDGHLENFIRLPAARIETSLAFGDTNRILSLTPVAQTTTGETVGNTSQFAAEADWLKTAAELNGVIRLIEVRGQRFTNVAFRLAAEATVIPQKNQ